jgi:DNA-directed RNA polymerase subunit RPC12/RpoP
VVAAEMSLKILCAGGSKEEKEAAESAVRAGIGARAAQESWTVSLVKLGRQWSVTLDGPEKTSPRSTFMAPEGRLRETISESLGSRAGSRAPSDAPAAPVTGSPVRSSTSGDQRRNSYQCRKCGKGFLVTYETEPGEPEETVPAACPHCWQIEPVKVGMSAAVNNDYRVDKS